MRIKEFYKNRLPHLAPIGAIFFVTFRLADSLPRTVIQALQEEFETRIQKLKTGDWLRDKELIKQEQKRLFGKYDNQLDIAPYGNCYLKQVAIVQIVKDKLHELDGILYDLQAYCIMPNHVHLLIDTFEQLKEQTLSPISSENYVQLDKIMQRIKGGTSRMANLALNRKGTFWQKDSYDHYVRNEKEWRNILAYILNNPVKAGLTDSWDNWPSSFCKYQL